MKRWGNKRSICLALTLALVISGFMPSVSSAAERSDPDAGNRNCRTFDFEKEQADWKLENAEFSTEEHRSGSSSLFLKNGSATIPVTGLEQGSYTVSMWVKGSAESAKLTLGKTGGPDSVLKIDPAVTADKWTQVAHTNVLVYNGQMEIKVTNAGSGMYIDDMELVLDSNDENPVANWGFEKGFDGWDSEGTVEITEDAADTGKKAVRLGDQSEISQTIEVLPDTDYVATVRLKVDRQDLYTSTEQMSLDGKTKLGIFVEREKLGNRVNLGVRGLDGVVLRQAPASTEGYALVTVAFHTAPGQTQVELYANTIYDQNYMDSVMVYENVDKENPYPNGFQRPNPKELENRHCSDEWKSNGSEFAYVDNFDVFQMNNDYIKGADMSFMQVIEDAGGKYFANGVQQDALRILSNHGVNSILSGIWVHAGNKVYDWNDLKPLETNVVGYDGEEVTGRQVPYDYFDENHTIALALRAQELGMTFTPSFHYSDTWISNAKAHIPLEWLDRDSEENLENPDIYMLETAVYNYVHDFLSDMKNAGVTNLITVKNGNEQDAGLLFPVGSGLDEEHAAVITASSKAVREIYPGVINTIHTNTGYTPDKYDSFFGRLNDAGAEYDGMGCSLYAGRQIYNQHTMMQEVLSNDVLKYYDYINVETAISYTKTPPVGNADSITTAEYDVTPTGQYNYLLNYIQAPLNVPNPYGVMRGFYYWNTEAIPVYGAGHKLGEAVAGTSRTMFNTGVASIQEMGSSQPGKNGDMMDSMYAYLHRGVSKAVSADTYTTINQTLKNYELGDAVQIKIENSDMKLKVGERERIHHKITPEDKVLKDYSVRYTSSDPNVASVSPYGFVSAISPGTATITTTVGEVSDSIQVTVSDSDRATGIQIDYEVVRNGERVQSGKVEEDQELNLLSGDKVRFTTELEGDPTSKEVVYSKDNSGIASWYGSTWQTDKEKMRTVATPISSKDYIPIVQLNAEEGGVTNIKAETADTGAELNFRVKVTELKIAGIEIEQGESCSVQVDNTFQLTAKITPEEAALKKVRWSSVDETVATVNQKGLVSAVKPGKTTITVSAEEDDAVSDCIELIVTNVKVEEILPSNKTVALLKGSEKMLAATVLPERAENKEIKWSVKQGGENIVSVTEDGCVKGLSIGETTVLASSCDGSGVTAECRVIVQDQPVLATGMTLSKSELWIDSNYFSPTEEGRGKGKATAKLDTVFEPEDTTNTNVSWTSDNEAVATVDRNGVVTVHQSGTAQITASAEEGNYTATTMVYVPFISEDWENYKTGNKGGGVDGETFTYQVVEKEGGKSLQASVEGKAGSSLSYAKSNSVNHYTFSPVSGKRLIVDFDWNTGTFVSDKKGRGGHISIEDSAGNTWLALAAFPATDKQQYELVYYEKDGSTAFPVMDENYNYIHGGNSTYSDCVKLEGLMAGKNEEYAVHLELDFESRTICFQVTSKENPEITKTVSDIPMDKQINYEDNIGGIAFSHLFNGAGSWNTELDNFSVYSTSVKPKAVEYTLDCVNLNPVTGIKLVPVTGALSSTATIHANVVPAEADQNVRFIVSGKAADYINITSDGVITIREDKQVSYENQSKIEAATEGNIRICAPNAPDVYQDIKFSVGPANTNEKLSIYANDEEFISEALEGKVGEEIALTFEASGGDGTSDVFSYKWEVVSGDAIIENNHLTALSNGTVEVKFTIDFFQGEITKMMKLHFGDVEKETLKTLLEKAKNYLEQTEVYTEESLKQLQEAVDKAQQVMESENAEQNEVNQAVESLQMSIDNLKKKVDKSLLQKAIKEAEKKKQEEYTEETWTVFVKALEKAKQIMDSPEATGEQVQQAVSELLEAMDHLEKPEEKPELQNLALEAQTDGICNYNGQDENESVWGGLDALNDAREPESSADLSNGAWHNWYNRYDTDGNIIDSWVSYTWDATVKIKNIAVYYYQDEFGNYLPQTAGLEYRDERGEWIPVETSQNLLCEADQYNFTELSDIQTTGLRLNMKPRENPERPEDPSMGTGVLEWKVMGQYAAEIPEPVQKEELKTVLEIAAEKEKEEYTPSTWQTFCAALEKAQDVYISTESTQEEVEQAKTDLEAAMEGLVLRADCSNLKVLIARAESKKETDYTAETWKRLTEVLIQAKEALDNPELVQSQAQELENALKNAMDNLQLKPGLEKTEKGALEQVIGIADKKEEEVYTPESWANFKNVLEKAKTVFADKMSTQEQIDEAVELLNSAIKALVQRAPEVKPNKIELKKLVEEAVRLNSEEYTKETWKIFQTALSDAQNVLGDSNAEQETVDKVTENLKKAISQLEKAGALKNEVDFTELKELIHQTEKMREKDYTAESWKKLKEALDEAKDILKKEGISQADVDRNVQNLKDAIDGLQKKKTNSFTSGSTSRKNGVKTGDSLPIRSLSILTTISFGVVILLLKKIYRENLKH